MRWVLAMRPRTLPAAATPVLVGTACAYAAGRGRPGPAIAAFVGALLLQIGANFANDVFDFERGADGPDRLGPTRAVAAGLVSVRAMRLATALVFGLAAIVGAYLVAEAGWPVLAIGLASIAAALAYTGGPWPLGYHGLGEVFVFAFFGLAATGGTFYVQAGRLDLRVALAACAVGALSSAIIVVNNLRDRASDARAGKRTLAVRLGRAGSVREYALLLALGYATCVALALGARDAWLLLPLASTPLALRLVARVRRTDGAALNPLLGQTATLLALFGVLLAIGLRPLR